MTLLHRLARALAYALMLCVAAPAMAQVPQVLDTCGTADLPLGPGGKLFISKNGNLCTNATGGGGGGGQTGSVTAPGTSGTQAQAVQGINGGVPQNVQASSWPLPTGAATAAKQPAFGAVGTVSPDVVTVQGAPNGEPQRIVPAQPDSVVTTYTITATGSTVGIPLTGYGSVFVELTGTFNAVLQAQVSTDTTDGVDGTWNDALGFAPESTGTAPNTTAVSTTGRRRVYRAQDGTFLRINASTFTSGTVTVRVVRKIAPVGERAVYVGGGLLGLNAGTNVIGSTTLRSAGTSRSATVGTTAVTLMAANTARQGWKVKNDSTGDVWINFDTTATATAGGGNFKVAAGQYLASEPGFVETGAMSAIGSAAGLNITAREH